MKKSKLIVYLVPAILLLVIAFITIKFQGPPEAKPNKQDWIPEYKDRVTDIAKMFTAEERRSIIKLLADYEKETAHQFVVLTVPTLNGEAINSFSLRVANSWGIGKMGFGNGILITVALKDRNIRIEIAFGLVKYIPDEMAKKIIFDDIYPFFRKQKYAEGIKAGLQVLMEAGRKYVIPENKRS